MKRSLLLFISLLFALMVQAQTDSAQVVTDTLVSADTPADTTLVLADSTTAMTTEEAVPDEPETFFQASLNIDYGKLATTVAGWDEKYEAGATLLFFNQYYLMGEYGQAVLSPENAFRNGTYTTEGSYYRLGGGYIKQITQNSRLGLGVLYSVSSFKDRGSIFISSPTETQSDYNKPFERMQLSARWLEIVITSENRVVLDKKNPEARINNLFALGFYLRARFLSTYDRFEPVDVYTVPGYGRTVNNPNLALNLFLKMYVF